jgi:hypothetical protein
MTKKLNAETNNEFLNDHDFKMMRRRKSWFINQMKSAEEIMYANERLREYLKRYPRIKMEQLELIKSIIYDETLKFRFQGWINKETDSEAIEKLLKTVNSLADKISVLHKRLENQVKGEI